MNKMFFSFKLLLILAPVKKKPKQKEMRNFKAFSLIAAVMMIFSVSNLKAQKNFFKDAEKAYNNNEYFAAIELYKKAYSKASKKNKAEILYKTAECYKNVN